MDEFSTDDLRGAATAANLRRAFAAPVDAEVPSTFERLLRQLGDASRGAVIAAASRATFAETLAGPRSAAR